MHRSRPASRFSTFPSRPALRLWLASIALALAIAGRARAAAPKFLGAPTGFTVETVLTFGANQFLGGIENLPDGGILVFDGAAVVLHKGPGTLPKILFAPPVVPTFGSFLKLTADGRSVYFGETHPGETPHQLYRIPLDAADGATRSVERLRFNFDLALDADGGAWVSSLEVPPNNGIYAIDEDPETPADAVITGIPGYSGPIVFLGGRLYCATALTEAGTNRVVYFTAEQLAAGRGLENEFSFETAALAGQVVAESLPTYYNLAAIDGRILASNTSTGSIDWIDVGGGTPFALPQNLPNGFASASYLAFRPGDRPFAAGAGARGGSLLVSLTDFTAFNHVLRITPELHFRRGAINGDPDVDIADAIALLDFLFQSGAVAEPVESADVNDDGDADISDAIFLLDYLFTGGAEPPPPFLERGPDPTL